jgi:hypothetical protein
MQTTPESWATMRSPLSTRTPPRSSETSKPPRAKSLRERRGHTETDQISGVDDFSCVSGDAVDNGAADAAIERHMLSITR